MRTRLFGLLFLTLLSSGCGSFGEDIIDPIVEMDGSVIVVPFKEPDYPSGLESPRGTDLALRAAKVMKGKQGDESYKLRPTDDLIDLYDPSQNPLNPRDLTPADICSRLKVDYVVTGEVRLWQLHDPGSVNMLRGMAVIDVTVYESPSIAQKRALEDEGKKIPLPKRAKAVASAQVTAVFPNEYGMSDIGIPDLDRGGEMKIDQGLKNVAARKVAELFYGHTKDEARLNNEGF